MPKKTRQDYPTDWSDIATRIKNRDGWKCQDCGLQFKFPGGRVKDERGKMQALTVHHKDRDTRNNADENLITLCSRCHCQWEWPLIRKEMRDKVYINQLTLNLE